MSAYTRNTLPVVPLRGIVAMPYVILSFDLGNSANIAAVDTAVGEDNRIIIVCRRDPRDPDTSRPALYDHACICRITKIIKLPEGNSRVFVEGETRVRLGSFTQETPFIRADFNELIDYPAPYEESSTHRKMISQRFRDFVYGNGKAPVKNVIDSIETITDDLRYTYNVANVVMQRAEDRQHFIGLAV